MMKTRSAIAFGPLTFGPLTLGLSVLMLGGTFAAATIADASSREQSRNEKRGTAEAGAAQAAFARGKLDRAIRHGEAAVGYQPNVVAYRMTLGQAYLKAGRFASARDAFADVLTLDAGNGKAALHFALAQIATGDWAGARTTLDAHADTIAVADRGLAIALAGDPAAAVEMLGTAARSPAADAKLRQNYALSLALAGRWREAQTVMEIDVAPADVSTRILEWATFSHPKSASDQVATLLGVTPAVDPGRPVALALVGTTQAGTTALAAAEPPIDTYMPGAPAAVPVAVAAVEAPATVVADREPVAVQIAAPVSRHEIEPKRAGRTKPVVATPAKGNFYVQIGAYDNAGVARDAWGRASRRYAALAGQTPRGMTVTTGGRTFYRLAVGGYARVDAVAMCQRYRGRGGDCFVRSAAGDQVAMWARGRELASR